MESEFITTYVYEVSLNASSNKWNGKYFTFVFDGNPSVSDTPHVRFHSTKQLTIKEVADRFINTAGIVAINGQFKDEISEEEQKLINSINDK